MKLGHDQHFFPFPFIFFETKYFYAVANKFEQDNNMYFICSIIKTKNWISPENKMHP